VVEEEVSVGEFPCFMSPVEDLVIRDSPDHLGACIGVLRCGDLVEVVGVEDGWYCVAGGGYVSMSFMRKVGE